MGVVSRADLQVALSRKMGYPLVDIDAFPAEADALRKIPYAAASRLALMPLLIREGRLILALDDPARRHAAVEEAEFIAQMKVVPVLAQSRRLEDVLHAAYEKIDGLQSGRFPESDAAQPIEFALTDTDKLIESLERDNAQGSLALDEEAQIEQSDNSLVRLINTMIVEAHKDGASDIHVESYPGREKIRIRFRKDGLMRTYLELPSSYRNAMVARIKIMCDLDISEKRKPQDGKINFGKFVQGSRLELRVATIPTSGGLEDVVMRILASAKPIPLPRIGLSERNLAELQRVVERPYGMVLCVGPTGSGKTTTLHSALSHINVPERKIWTAEDPVEITQPGLRQVQVNPKIDWTFARALRAFLRADPDVIMVGEMRDKETVSIGIEASLTGHLVFATLHTNSAPESIIRLLDMGMDPFNFSDALLGILAQRLAKRLCTDCKKPHAASNEEIRSMLNEYSAELVSTPIWKKDPAAAMKALYNEWVKLYGDKQGQLTLYGPVGCDKCAGTGYRGRVGLHELLIGSDRVKKAIQEHSRVAELLEIAIEEGMHTLKQDGMEKVLQGITDMLQVRTVCIK